MSTWPEMTPREKAVHLHDEFMQETADLPTEPYDRTLAMAYINTLLDTYLDMWPELAYEAA